MKTRNKSLRWAFNQFANRSLQTWSYKRDRGISKPTRFIFGLTLRCNIKCEQCAIWRMPKTPELNTNEWKSIVTDLRDWVGPYRAQLAGGEPFIRKDLLDIVRHATRNDVFTGVVTNGTLIDRSLAEDIVDSGLSYIHVSVDGIKPETHDELRGIRGVYDKTMSGIDHLVSASRGSGPSISIASVINRKNVKELVDLVHFVEEKGLKGIIFNPIGPTVDSDVDWYKKSDLWIHDVSEVDDIIDTLISMKKKGAKIMNPVEHFLELKQYFRKPYLDSNEHCMVGMTNLGIKCDGSVYTCFKMPSLGNVREMKIKDMWDSDQANSVRCQIKNCDIHCSPSNFVYRRSLYDEVMRYLRFE